MSRIVPLPENVEKALIVDCLWVNTILSTSVCPVILQMEKGDGRYLIAYPLESQTFPSTL